MTSRQPRSVQTCSVVDVDLRLVERSARGAGGSRGARPPYRRYRRPLGDTGGDARPESARLPRGGRGEPNRRVESLRTTAPPANVTRERPPAPLGAGGELGLEDARADPTGGGQPGGRSPHRRPRRSIGEPGRNPCGAGRSDRNGRARWPHRGCPLAGRRTRTSPRDDCWGAPLSLVPGCARKPWSHFSGSAAPPPSETGNRTKRSRRA